MKTNCFSRNYKTSLNFVETSNSAIQNELNINPDQLLVKGVKKYIIDINLIYFIFFIW